MSDRERQWIRAGNAIRPHLVNLVGSRKARTIDAALVALVKAARAGKSVADRIKALLQSEPATAEWAANFLAETRQKRRAERAIDGQRLTSPPVTTHNEYVVVQVFFGTDRDKTGNTNPAKYYGGKRGAFSYGIADVSIPRDHRMGSLESPALWRLQFQKDPAKHLVVLRLKNLERDAFLQSVRDGVAASPNCEALLFVHGYNVSFEDAARRTAQISYDLGFSGIPILYSWPSEAAKLRYIVDENNVRWTVPHFNAFLQLLLTRIGARIVHAIAHSMGNRCLTESLRTFDQASLGEGAAALGQVIFAAPDIDSETFVDLARDFRRQATRFTLYASSTDRALLASKAVNGYPRAGDAGPGLVIADGIDTVDATLVDTNLMGHSYIAQNDSILADVFDLLKDGRAPSERFRLAARQRSGKQYWYFKA
jgi:esterase/lipase superfamily enzyme